MIENPDPSKFTIRKLRNKGYVLVAISILTRRKRNKEILSPIENKRKLGRPKLSQREKLRRLLNAK